MYPLLVVIGSISKAMNVALSAIRYILTVAIVLHALVSFDRSA
jgi:hypothetical protein